jgi:hypothetical protein
MLWLASWRKSQHSDSLFAGTLNEGGVEAASAGCRGQLFSDHRSPERRGAA